MGRSQVSNVADARVSRYYRRRLVLQVVVGCFLLGQMLLYGPDVASKLFAWLSSTRLDMRHESFSWERTQATKDLKWHTCMEKDGISFECAQLAVPLDYFNGTTDKDISLALIRVPARVPVTDPRYGGAILFNPGGPGGSGVEYLQRSYKRIAGIVDGEQSAAKSYDYVSFDPRGIGRSAPAVQCFQSDMMTFAWDLRLMEEGILGSSNAAFGRLWSMTAALSGSCSLSAVEDEQDIKKFVSTASVAADMVTIIERHGQWREAEARRLLSSNHCRHKSVPERLLWNVGQEKINYWGFSYGTYIGMTFAAMYPDRINRVIVDGVVDADDYVQSLWSSNLADTETEMQSFYTHCAKAGYPRCVFANDAGNTTSEELQTRAHSIIDGLLHNPLPVLHPYAEVVTYSDVKNVIFAALYSPIQAFPLVATVLRDLERGDGSIVAQLLRSYHQPQCPGMSIADPQPVRNGSTLAHDATIAIGCGDGDPQQWVTKEIFREHYHNLTKLSPTIGPMWALYRGHCIHWTVRPLYRFTGPWSGNTSHPLLFIGNSADPVTPVRSARKFVGRFHNAGLVEQGSAGHCSLAAKSSCTERIIHNYFQHGVLPEAKEVFCEADEVPFGSDMVDAAEAYAMMTTRLTSGLINSLMPLF